MISVPPLTVHDLELLLFALRPEEYCKQLPSKHQYMLMPHRATYVLDCRKLLLTFTVVGSLYYK